MAAALMRKLGGDNVAVHSAGTKPGSGLNEGSRESVERMGADFEGEFPKPVTQELLDSADRVVVIGTEARIEQDTATPIEVWDTDEPSLRGIEGDERMDMIRDELQERVEKLYSELTE